MHGYIPRRVESDLERALERSPAVAVLGPRQCGKTTMARRLVRGRRAVYLDLQDRADRNKLSEPELFLEQHRDELVCLDEIQLAPEIFPVLRVEIDRQRRPGRFLILGSASRELLKQGSESLAGRLALVQLTPFILPEMHAAPDCDLYRLWTRGGFPPSLLATDDEQSFAWRDDFIRTFLERDIPRLGLGIPIPVMETLWRLLAHYHGQTLNYNKLAEAADLSVPTLKKYLALLEQTYMLRLLRPFTANLKKRLVKAPKLYLRDSGILHCLLGIESYDELLANPVRGASWEGMALETVLALRRGRAVEAGYLRTGNGAEIDLVLSRAGRMELFEFKAARAPKPSRGFFTLKEDLQAHRCWLVAPVEEPYDLTPDIRVTPPMF